MPRPALKRDAIERGALELFAEHGIDGTSIRMIAQRAGVTEGALYRHHAGKDALVRALFFHSFEKYARILTEAQASRESLREKLHAMIAAFYGGYDEDPLAFRFVLQVQHDLLDEVRQDQANPVEVITGVLREPIRRGEIPKQDVDLAAQMLLGLVMQATTGHRYGRLSGRLARHADTVTDACMAVLRRQEGS